MFKVILVRRGKRTEELTYQREDNMLLALRGRIADIAIVDGDTTPNIMHILLSIVANGEVVGLKDGIIVWDRLYKSGEKHGI